MRARLLAMLQSRTRPPFALGILIAALCIALETLLADTLQSVAPVHALDVVYLLGIVVVASVWGLWLGVGMAMVSTFAFDYFLIPPAWTFSITKTENWTVLAVFIAIALLSSAVARLALSLAVEAEERTDAALAADLARLLLGAPDLKTAMPAAGDHLAAALDLPSARIELGTVVEDGPRVALPLHHDDAPLGTLLVPAGLPRRTMRGLRERVVPSLEVLLQAARERERVADALKSSRDELRRIAEEQAALRRLATLVAHAEPPAEIFAAVARELGEIVGAKHTTVVRYEPGDMATSVGIWNQGDRSATMPLGSRWSVEVGSVSDLVARRSAPARITGYPGAGPLMTALREMGVISSAGCPIVVGGRLWGAVIASSTRIPLPDDTEQRMQGFAELVAAAISNAENHAQLIASRARVVEAADATRRLIERDLHDGAQQRLVSLKLELCAAEASVPPELEELKGRLSRTTESLEGAVENLREISRGLHPAILSRRGLEPALTALARRSAIPVELDMSLPGSLPEPLEVNTYYIVSEALTNAAKHSHASVIRVSLIVKDAVIHLSIRDDGTGGAEPGRGSGLISLSDRVETLGGRLEIVSPPEGGTSLVAEIPVPG